MKPTFTRRLVFTAAIALLALAVAPSGAGIGHWDTVVHWDRITFSGPVALPGVVLPAGAYKFEIANPESSLRVVRVSRSDTGRVYFAGFTRMRPRPEDLGENHLVTFGEAPRGQAVPISVWYPRGRSQGYEFIYR
jgi:hypothetical protein